MQAPKTIFSGYHGGCHCQGIAVDPAKGYIYYSFTTKLIKSDLQGNLIGSVDGLIGHLGCIDFCERDGRVYGSLEYKNDIIGRSILKHLQRADESVQNGFYCVIFDVDRIDRMGMNAETDGIMRAVFLPEVVQDFEASVTLDGVPYPHKYGCSGIDGLGWGPRWGTTEGEEQLRVCYGIYDDVDRPDNNGQIILTFDAADWWDTLARPLKQSEMHRCGACAVSKCFVPTGSTHWGVQNLEYDAATAQWMLAVYRGHKPEFPNYDLFFIDATATPSPRPHAAYGETIPTLPLAGEGVYFPYGATGLYAFGDGRYYFSQKGRDPERGEYTNVVLYRRAEEGDTPFLPIE